ncbi:MAG: CoA transferase [Planctomycetia bacterium]|nr:CoA transferase [Planctomycetia bacterium]
MTTRADLPLAGLKVLDLSRILAGPMCAQILADLGADVVKIERPQSGDDTRQWGPPFLAADAEGKPGPSAYYLSCNRGKRSMALDLSKPEAREVLDDLLRTADVMLENFLPETLAKLGLTPERLRTLNPRLVSCSISGYGRTGPNADLPGYDLAIQAASGLMSITGERDRAPMKVGVAISDVVTGLYAAVSVLAGLIGRGGAGEGRQFDVALADCTLAALVNVAQSTLATGRRPARYGNAHPQIVPYESFATADGHLVLAIGADRQWVRFCQAIEKPVWSDHARFRTNPDRVAAREVLVPLVAEEMLRRTTAEWETLLTAADVPHARIAHVDEALASKQTEARGMVREVVDDAGRTVRLLGNPIHWPERPDPADDAPSKAMPPGLGAHTDEVLRHWLDYADDRLLELRRAGVIA